MAGMASLLAAVWGGLIRLPFNLPLPAEHANWITFHGPLMVCGFLGTVIGLERAVGLRQTWTYAAPLLTGAGAISLLLGVQTSLPVWLILAGSALFAVVAWRVVWLQPAVFTVLMAIAALAWVTGNALWIAQWTFPRIVPWWIAFLALTIVGERLDLSRFQKPTRSGPPLLAVALGIFGTGVLVSVFFQVAGERLLGAGLLALALWLAWFDLARRTVKQTGLTRFMAVCLLAGYFWLGVSGVLLMAFPPLTSGLLTYDAALHSFFLGFIFSMIFGHAPVIFPSVLNLRPVYRPIFYGPLAVLHAGLLLRVVADLTGWYPGRQWGGAIGAIALALFLVNTILNFAFPPKNP